jgi:hypothetical protein
MKAHRDVGIFSARRPGKLVEMAGVPTGFVEVTIPTPHDCGFRTDGRLLPCRKTPPLPGFVKGPAINASSNVISGTIRLWLLDNI